MSDWPTLLRLLPGYDPYRDADGCWFDEAAAQLVLDFFPECLRHIEGALAGQPFVLQPWQQCYVANLFGWKTKDEQGRTVRRYRETILFVPRKSGKTPLVAGLALYVLFCDVEQGQQNYVAAADREQAGMLFRHCKGMVEAEPELSARCKIFGGNATAGQSRSIVRADTGSFLRVISADAHTKHGGNSHLVVIDELHTQPNRELVDVLSTSMASANRAQPLMIYITTADFDRPSICNEKHKYACAVRDGRVQDARFLPAIWEADAEKDDWTSEETWKKANPNLGVSVSLDYLRRECAKAKDNPALEFPFKRLHLNMVTASAIRCIDLTKWDACGEEVDYLIWRREQIERLKGATCYAGLDLGSHSDLTALVLLFREADGWTVLPFFWVPRERSEERRRLGKAPYDVWIQQGLILQTAGDVTDYDEMLAEIVVLGADYWIQEVAVDRLLFGVQVCTNLRDAGFNVIAFGQGYVSMAGPVRQLLDEVGAGRLHHGHNPVLRWMAGNVVAERSKRKDLEGKVQEVLKFSKEHSADKIDGLTALCMAMGRAMLASEDSGPTVTII